MDRVSSRAFEAAKEITIAKVQNSTSAATTNSGNETAGYFEAVYNKLFEIAQKANND